MTRKELKFFSISQHEKEQEYLRSMHKSGWKLVKTTGLGMYHFEACEPEDVIYQLDYNAEGLANKDEYVQMFEDCGWEYIQEFVGYSYFRKPASKGSDRDEEIFCDDESRAQMMERVFKGRLIPLLVIFFVVFIPQFFTNMTTRKNVGITITLGVMLVAYMSIFVTFTIQYLKLKNKAKR
jgi:hypothetical protein